MARKWVGEQKTTPRFMRRQGKGNLGFAILLFWVVAFGFWLITTPPGLRNEKQDGNGRASLPSDKEELDEESVAEPYESTAFDTSKHLKCFSLDCTKPVRFLFRIQCALCTCCHDSLQLFLYSYNIFHSVSGNPWFGSTF